MTSSSESIKIKRITESGTGPYGNPQGVVLSVKCEGESAPQYFLLHTLEAPIMALALLHQAQENAPGLPLEELAADLEQKFHMASTYPIEAVDFKVIGNGYCLLNLGFCTLTIKMGDEMRAKLKSFEPSEIE